MTLQFCSKKLWKINWVKAEVMTLNAKNPKPIAVEEENLPVIDSHVFGLCCLTFAIREDTTTFSAALTMSGGHHRTAPILS